MPRLPLCIALVALLAACPDPPADFNSLPAEPEPSAVVGAPSGPTPPADADEAPSALAPEVDRRAASLPADAPARIAARHILVSYQGAVGAKPSLRRSRAEAQAQAQKLHGRLAAGEDFSQLATAFSDDPSAARGGSLGAFGQGVMTPAFEEAAFRLAVGERSGVVETPFGFHLIQRDALDELRASQIVVQWAGAERSSATRSQDEARQRIEEAAARIAAGEAFATVAAQLSDGPSAIRGGDLGWFQRGQLLPQIEEAAFSLKVGETSGVVQSPVGLHLVHRIE